MKKLEPYLFANGRADEMIGFYQQALDAEVQIRMTFGESPAPAQMPLGQTFWSPLFGMVTDKFGIGWMIGANA